MAGGGVSLVFARTETRNFQRLIFPFADSMLFLSGRLAFHRPDGSLAGNAQAPSVLISYSDKDSQALSNSNLEGYQVKL